MNAMSDLNKLAGAAADAVALIRGDAVRLEPVRWLFPGYLPSGMLAILGGAPGTGKTTIALTLAAIVTRGREKGARWPDGALAGPAGDVLICSMEDAVEVLAARLVAAGADMTRVHFVNGLASGEEFDPARDMPLLEAEAARLPALRLLIIDPIVSAVSGDSHKGAEVRRSLQPVISLGQRAGCSVLGITHFSKGTGGRDPIERITGSIAFAALPRVLMVAAKVRGDGIDAEPRRLLMRAKSNVGPDDGGFAYELERAEVAPDVEGQRVRWLEAIEGSARDMLAEAENDQVDEDSGSGVDEFLRGLLADGPMPAKAIKGDADGAGYAWSTVQKAATRLGVERRKKGMKEGWVWGLTEPKPKPPRTYSVPGTVEPTDLAEDTEVI